MTITDPGTIETRACNGLDLADFFPENGDHLTAAAAKRVCATCPIADICLEWALHHEGGYGHAARAGYYGGLSPRQRAAEAARRRKEGDNPTPPRVRIDPNDVKECETCGTQIRRRKQSHIKWAGLRFCSRQCHGAAMVIPGAPETKTCEQCGQQFGKHGRQGKKWLEVRFCGVACAGMARRKVRAA